MIPVKKKIVLIMMALALTLSLIANPTNQRIRRSTLPPTIESENVSLLNANNGFRNSAGTRNRIPPSNLTASVEDNVNVRLNWEEPTDLIRLFYHSGHPHDAYIQEFNEGFGTVFDLREYPGATLQLVDFRHSSYGELGEWEYKIVAVDWLTGNLITSTIDTTVVNDGWERDIFINEVEATDYVGIFIIPRGNEPTDAYPVIDFDFAMEGNSMIVEVDGEGFHFSQDGDGDFLIDLRIRPGLPGRRTGDQLVSAPRITRNLHAIRERAVYRNLLGYNVYRDEQIIFEIDDPETTTYLDTDLEDDTYGYYVTAVYERGESESTDTVYVNVFGDMEVLFYDDFSSYPDFVTNFHPWTTIDLDGSDTYGFEHHAFPGQTLPMAWIIFNPLSVTPPINNAPPHSGTKFAASIASVHNRNNNWLISPRLTLGTNSSLSFYVRTYNAEWGLERFRVGISTTEPEPGSFQIVYPLAPEQYAEAPVVWSEVVVDLSAYDHQSIHISVQCISDATFILFLDSFKVSTMGGSDVEEVTIAPESALTGNYPNPFNPETTIYFDLQQDSFVSLDIYNIKGQIVNNLTAEHKKMGQHKINWDGKDSSGNEVTSGVYYYRITTDADVLSGKMLLLK